MSDLNTLQCKPCEGGVAPLSEQRAKQYLDQLHTRWALHQETQIQASFTFSNYYETTAFINAVTWVAHQQDHHPDIEFGYNAATIRYTTHAIKGLSENDFICAARIDALLN